MSKVYLIKKGKRVLVELNKPIDMVYDKDNEIKPLKGHPYNITRVNQPVHPSHIQRAWRALYQHVIYEMTDHRYSDVEYNKSEDQVRFSRHIAYGELVYKSFTERRKEATMELMKLIG